MIYETLTYGIDHDIAVITLNRPTVMNALNTQMRAEITHAMRQAGQAARVVVFLPCLQCPLLVLNLIPRAKLSWIPIKPSTQRVLCCHTSTGSTLITV